jgi:hypothetical protein
MRPDASLARILAVLCESCMPAMRPDRPKSHKTQFFNELLDDPRPLRLTNEPILWVVIVKFDARMPSSTVEHP